MFYFAYGSNLDWEQMRKRCPSASFIGAALLSDYRLTFTRRSVKRACGVADAVHEAGRVLWGVVYRISDLDVGKLDKFEGYWPGREKNSYWRRECMVFLDGDEKRPLSVWTYFAEPEAQPPLPNKAYKEQILSGARYWHLPEEYIQLLEGIEVGQ